jgi:hypothetical protein
MAEFVVKNLDDVTRAFQRAGQSFTNEKNAALRTVGVPIANQAENLARARIRNIGSQWSKFRVGKLEHSVYVAPVKRGTRDAARKRRKLADLLLSRAMLPAAAANLGRVERELDRVLANMERRFRSG